MSTAPQLSLLDAPAAEPRPAVTSSARWPCHYRLRRPRREPRSWLLVLVVLVAVVGAAVVGIVNMGSEALR